MSGNPFRRPQADGDAGFSGEKKKKKVKKVQFVSPISSPQEPPSHPRFPSLEELEDTRKSPPLRGTEFDNIDTKALLRGDLTAGGAIDLQANESQHDSSASSTATPTFPPVPLLSQPPPGKMRGPPPNPFAKRQAAPDEHASDQVAREQTKKPAMDVDAFKRLLLTGKAEAPSEEGSLSQKTLKSDDTGPSQAPDAPAQAARTVSPVESLEDASLESASEDEEGTDSDPRSASSAAQIQKQTPPSVLTFDDFEADLEGAQEAAPGTLEDHVTSAKPGIDLEKPLPTLPVAEEPSAQDAGADAATKSAQPTKRLGLPPPPPSSRRGIKPGNRSRSSSIVAGDTPTAVNSSPSPASGSKPKAPPPRAPPPRTVSKETKRIADLQDNASSSTDSTSTVLTPDSLEAMPTTKSKPPPPPSRSTAKSAPQPLKRTPSSSSSITNRRSSAQAPPPPPRPRRGHDRSVSTEGGKASNAEAADTQPSSRTGSDRRDSVSSQQRSEQGEAAKAEAEQEAARDMLADLDAFQREVDALRAKALAGK